MKKLLQKIRGESIIESLIGIAIIIIALAGIMALFSDNIRLNHSTRNRIIAINLAREGIEAVRFVRDSNWLVYSNDRRVCWNNDTENDCVDSGSDGITDFPLNGNYNAVMDPADFTWKLEEDSDGLDLDNQLNLHNNFYLHTASGSTTPFQRQIQISYVDETGSGISVTNASENNRMKVLSIVQWGNNEKIELETVLTDFLERTWHDN